ncbi:Uncharacterized protein ESCO_002671 [Escovopsis weberi]|uniref:VanZ-like domain-containing protein n=1 Tax=Escovopsis weberi TaxID=150374 RepID=A0A0N0RT29_ESCWE|nr:Uncharacterized protein ESCO_002671 [Escovopsis weberi]
MRIRLPFAGIFLLLLSLAGYAGLTTLKLGKYVNDKVLHFLTFFILTVVFYWVVDTSRRRTLHMTAIACTLILGVGSEFLQAALPNDRDFDAYDVAANVVGSLLGLGLCTWYHKRMLERKRQRKTYAAVPGEDTADVELGEGHETGVTAGPARSLEEVVDNWDENAVDHWDDEVEDVTEAPQMPPVVNKEASPADTKTHGKRMD